MKVLKNSSLRILLFLMFMLSLPLFVIGGTIKPDDFEIVIVGGGGGPTADPTTATYSCDAVLRIEKRSSAVMPDDIVLTAFVKGLGPGTFATSTQVVIKDTKNFFLSDAGYVTFPDLLAGQAGSFIVIYTMKIRASDDELEKNAKVYYPPSEFCATQATEARFDTQDNSISDPIKNLRIFPTLCNDYQDILYQLREDAYVSINIFDMQGRMCATIKNEHQEKGDYFIYANTSMLSAGMYFYRIEVNGIISLNSKFVKAHR